MTDDLGCRVGDADWKDLSFFFPLETTVPFSAPVKPADFKPPILQAQSPYQSHQHIQPQQLAVRNQANYMQQSAANSSLMVNPYQNGDYQLGPRFFAMFIDKLCSIPLMIMAAIPFVGIVGAPLLCLYLISRDSIFGGQSIGKKMMGLRVVRSDGRPFTWSDSVRRNLLYFIYLGGIVPGFGLVFLFLAFPILFLIELFLIITSGQRIGDKMGNTYVVRA